MQHDTSILGNIFGSQCKDHFSVDATCGLARDANSQPIPDSQGTCCTCSFEDQIGVGSQDESSRGGIDCALFGNGQASAHCLRFDDL